MLLQTLLALGLVCGLALVVFRFVLPRLGAMKQKRSMVRVIDRVGLEPRRSLYVIETGGKWLLIGVSEAGVQLVSELDAAQSEIAAANIERARANSDSFKALTGASFGASLERLMNKKR